MEVSIGEETEPVLLNIAPPQGDSFIRGFSRSLLLDEVVRLACDEFQLDEARVAVQRPVGKGTDYRHTKHRACFLIVGANDNRICYKSSFVLFYHCGELQLSEIRNGMHFLNMLACHNSKMTCM